MNIKYKIINHHSPNHTSEGQVCCFGFHVLLFFVYTSCSAVVPVNLVLLFTQTHPSPAGLRRISSHLSLISNQLPVLRLSSVPAFTACSPWYSLLMLLVLLVSTCICLERPVTNVFLSLVSSSASLSDSLDLSPHSLATCTGPLCVKIHFPTQPLPHLGSQQQVEFFFHVMKYLLNISILWFKSDQQQL